MAHVRHPDDRHADPGDPGVPSGAAGEDRTRERIDFLLDVGCGLLESGQTTAKTRHMIERAGGALGLQRPSAHSYGTVLSLQAGPEGGPVVTGAAAARTLDAIDCTRARSLTILADAVSTRPASAQTRASLEADHRAVERLRETATPWWAVTAGMTMLALFISMQVGVSWRAWLAAMAVQVVSSAVGMIIGPWRAPKLVTVALQSSAAGGFATWLVRAGVVDPVGAAAAIAVNWLLLLPLPQLIGAVTDAMAGDVRAAAARIWRVVLAGAGLVCGGVFIYVLGESLGMEHPRLDSLPTLPWYLIVVFSALGAVGNAFANGGRLSLAGPAATLGCVTAAVNQVLMTAVGLPALVANVGAALVLGIVTGVFAVRAGYPQQVLALMGITGALLPGIAVFFGILQQMGGASGLVYYAQAIVACGAIGVGVAVGVLVFDAFSSVVARIAGIGGSAGGKAGLDTAENRPAVAAGEGVPDA